MFRLKLFGSASIDGPDGRVTGRAVQRRRLGLLALLAVAGERGMTRDKLVGYLWPDSDAERARHLLSDSVYRINQAVGGEAVVAVGDDLRLNPERLPSDAWEFAESMERGDWERAVELHVAPFLDGFFLTDADELERWVDGQRERLARESARALEALAERAERDGSAVDAVQWWRMLAAQDPWSSRIALRLMRALDSAGERAAALQHARVHAQLLEDEMGLTPDAELLAFVTELRTRPPPALPPLPATRTSAEALAGSMTAPDAAGAPGSSDDAETDAPSSPARGEPAVTPAPRRARWMVAAALVLLAATIVAAAFVVSRSRERADAAGVPQALAVLPFADLSADGAYEYFADGLTEELMARLANVDGLNVVGRTSVFAFKDEPIDVRDIAARLNVTAVLQGSVRHSGDRLRIVVQLIDARNGYQLWTDSYEREVADVFVIQDDISRQIVTRLRGELSGVDAARLTERSSATDDPEAFNLYLKGRYEWHQRTESSLRAAAEFFQQAVDRAPAYALAHAGLGDAYAVLGFYDFVPPRTAFPSAAAAARRALELNPSLVEPHATLGYVALYYDWDWPQAESEFRRAIETEPGYSTAHQWYANYLTAMGRFDEAASRMGTAMELDPLSVIANAALGWVHFYAGDYERTIRQCTRALDLNRDFALAYLWRGMAHMELGDTAAALADHEQSVRLSGGSAIHVAAHAHALAHTGRPQAAATLMAELVARTGSDYVPPYEMAKLYDALGDRDAALASLEQAYDDRSHSMAFLAVDPQLRALHDEPRFRRLIRLVGLEATPGGQRLR
ncbi:MAG TPA: BTAD domain-containing putative transcriptional regulator [Longimicrobiales bacterium]|nr:BTAD domain-containing putative transcriptional regulator [Longimicrobiales bacterium]